MVDKKKLGDVFKTVGLPPYTYVKPTYYNEVKADILQAGKHLLIEGPSGIGKTCVVFKVCEELGWAKDEDFSYLSCRDSDALDRINAFLDAIGKGQIPRPPDNRYRRIPSTSDRQSRYNWFFLKTDE